MKNLPRLQMQTRNSGMQEAIPYGGKKLDCKRNTYQKIKRRIKKYIPDSDMLAESGKKIGSVLCHNKGCGCNALA